MLKLILFFLVISNFIQAQQSVLLFVKDSDVVFINHTNISELKINTISFIEHFDSLQFLNYPIPSSSIKFIKHKTEYNREGYSNNYEWSFDNSESLIEDNKEKSSGSFFISNEYKFEYANQKIKDILVSDASPISKITYKYLNDSIYEEINSYSSSSATQVFYNTFSENYNKVSYSNTGKKQYYFPLNKILYLGKIISNNIFVNGFSFNSFFDKKFDNNRFIIEIHPGMWILFEIID